MNIGSARARKLSVHAAHSASSFALSVSVLACATFVVSWR
jgi:hypothetical protein